MPAATATFGVGQNYLHVCNAAQASLPEASRIAEGIRKVLAGRKESFSIVYDCSGPDSGSWYKCIVTPFVEGEWHGALVSHADVTAEMQ